MDGASLARSNGRTGEVEHLLYSLDVCVIFLQRQKKLCLFPERKTPIQGARPPSLSDVNFAAYGHILKCKIFFHKEMSWCSAGADTTRKDVGQGLSAVWFYEEKGLWDFKSLFWSQADQVFLDPGKTLGIPLGPSSCISTPSLLPAQPPATPQG